MPPLQRQVVSLYRQFVRAIRTKDPGVQAELLGHVRGEFVKRRGIPRPNIQLIEHHLRHGARQLELLREPSVTGISGASWGKRGS